MPGQMVVPPLAPLREALHAAHRAAQAATRAARDVTGPGNPDHWAGQAAGLAHALRLLDVHERGRSF